MDRRAASAGAAASATMRAVVVSRPGGLDALQVTTVVLPTQTVDAAARQLGVPGR
ncbi:hypothetical protein [Streptomyces canus]|uniref:Uncharacterized protein n=1 Tax=Streptomyces canus TaxID=58343 RepID=A0AAW8F741_9ACTN|nr:hypothetical protein [Streptomyces canus]MDQ0766893.1 hypothetical protein [Streptomyces canus]MDQ0905080.1 hypothetical protein [Streptomyces canus]